MELSAFRSEFDTFLFDYLEKRLSSIYGLQLPDQLNDVWKYIDSYAHGGKRVRPYLVYLMYTGFGGTDKELAFHIGLAHELTHIFALIHDDIMDKGLTRHSVPTYHLYAGDLYDNEHVGVSQAILVGDLLYTWAVKNFMLHNSVPTASKYFFDMLEEVIVGQSLDIHLSHVDLVESMDIIETKDKIKSGNYTFTKPMLVGASLAQSDKLHDVEQLGELLGQAYQMRDDLFDVIEGHTNKTTYSDLAEGNQTIVFYHALAGLSQEDRETLINYRRKHLSENDISIIGELFKKSGALEKTKVQINDMLDKASQLTNNLLAQETDTNQGLQQLITYLRV